ncbi:MAG: CsiV family protein [Gammaproteobacteria bacterium]|nr:CsiV family protein [Gammaproteobacteria bacterium]
MDDGGEIWPEKDERPQWDNALAIFRDANDSRFTPLSSSRYKMSGIYRVLRSSQGYRPILHLAWEQAGLPSSRARPVYVASDNGQVEGTLKLEQSRFLHIEMDLVYPFGDQRRPLCASKRTPAVETEGVALFRQPGLRRRRAGHPGGRSEL